MKYNYSTCNQSDNISERLRTKGRSLDWDLATTRSIMTKFVFIAGVGRFVMMRVEAAAAAVVCSPLFWDPRGFWPNPLNPNAFAVYRQVSLALEGDRIFQNTFDLPQKDLQEVSRRWVAPLS